MRKFILSLVAVLYIASSSGAVMHLHYCMNKLIGWELWESKSEKNKCSKCGMSKSGKKKICCKDENKFVKITKDQKAISGTINLSRPVLNLIANRSHYSSVG
ncbi:MAG: hypothetical protein HYX40_07695 [Sphingobacteriales bacterium]|nr:hypothetical protein [Sphingobacteriales bacterium]